MTTPSAKDAFENELIPYALLRTDGLPAIKTYLKNGEFHGPYVARDDKGQPEATGIYYEGKRVGIWSLLQEGGYALYNKDGKEHVRISDLNDLDLHIRILEETLPLSHVAISEAEALVDQRQAQEDAYQTYRRGQPQPGF